MLTLKNKLAAAISAGASAAFPTAALSPDEIAGMLEYPPDPAMGDLALPCFKLSRQLRTAPPRIAAELSEAVTAPDEIARIEVAGGYLNFHIDRQAFAARVIDDVAAAGADYGSPHTGGGRTVVLD